MEGNAATSTSVCASSTHKAVSAGLATSLGAGVDSHTCGGMEPTMGKGGTVLLSGAARTVEVSHTQRVV